MGYYVRHRPAADLAALVESVWVQQASASPATTPPTTVLPLGRAEMLIHFGEPFEHWDGTRFARVPACYAMGQRTRPLLVRATGLVLVSLWPWAAQALVGVPPAYRDGLRGAATGITRMGAHR